jgi:hypothetical protein
MADGRDGERGRDLRAPPLPSGGTRGSSASAAARRNAGNLDLRRCREERGEARPPPPSGGTRGSSAAAAVGRSAGKLGHCRRREEEEHGKLGRSLISVSLGGTKGYVSVLRAVSTQFRGRDLGKFCGMFTRYEVVPRNFVSFQALIPRPSQMVEIDPKFQIP